MSSTTPSLIVAFAVTIGTGYASEGRAFQESIQVSGQVVDRTSPDEAPVGVRLSAGAEVFDADGAGGFHLVLPEGVRVLVVEAPGYHRREIELSEMSGWGTRRISDLVIELELRWFELDAVVVTADPTGGGARYQPAQALSGQEIRRRSATSLGALLDGEPGVAARSMGPAPGRPVIRGFDGERILVLQNGERMGDLSGTAGDHAVALDPLALDRVEVVRGPAGLLYGSNALGGVVNVLDGDAPSSFSGRPRAELLLEGTAGMASSTASARMQWGAPERMGSLRISRRDAGSVGTPMGRIPATERELTEAALGGAFDRGEWRGEAVVGIQGQRYGIPEDFSDPDPRVGIRMQREYLRGRVETVRDGWVRGAELRMHAARYRHDESEAASGSQGVVRTVDVEFRQWAAGGTFTVRHGALTSRGLTPVESGSLGVHFTHRDLELVGPGAFHPDGRTTTAGAFLFQESPAYRGMRLQAGLRVERDWLEVAHADAAGPIREGRRPGITRSGSLGANWRMHRHVEAGVQWARAHRLPTLEELHSAGAHLGTGAYEVGNPELSPEVGTGVDFHLRLGGDHIRSEIAIFQNRIRDFVVLLPTGEIHDPSGLPILRYDAVAAELRGGEVSLEIRPARTFAFRSGLDVVYGRRLDTEGGPLPFMPPLRGFVDAAVEREEGWAGIRIRGLASQRRVSPGESATAGTVLASLRLGIRLPGDGDHILQLRVDNLLNATWRDHLSRIENRDLPMPGRTVTLGYRWSLR